VGPVGTHGEYERGEEIDEDVVAGGHASAKTVQCARSA